MYPKEEVREYAELLQLLNEGNDLQQIRGTIGRYNEAMEGGGTDGVPHFKFVENGNILIIWVRGTRMRDPNDILINFQVEEVPFYNGKCHKGYLNGALGIIKYLRNYIDNKVFNKLVCLGHSLGGAVSSLIAMILNKGNGNNVFIEGISELKSAFNDIHAFVYGTPPTFSSQLSDQSKRYITNMILDKDIVPKLADGFKALQKLQNNVVFILLFNIGAYHNNDNNAYNAYINATNLNNTNFTYNNDNADKLPGIVFILDPQTRNIRIGGNMRNITSFLDILGIFEHRFEKYLNIIRIADINVVVIQRKMPLIRKIGYVVGGTVLTGITAYLSVGTAIAFGALSAIASS